MEEVHDHQMIGTFLFMLVLSKIAQGAQTLLEITLSSTFTTEFAKV